MYPITNLNPVYSQSYTWTYTNSTILEQGRNLEAPLLLYFLAQKLAFYQDFKFSAGEKRSKFRNFSCHITIYIYIYSDHPSLLEEEEKLWWRSSAPCRIFRFTVTSSFFISNIPLSTMLSNNFNLCSSLKVREQVSHPCTTRGNISVHIF
jgi:hypothetical protein